MKKPICEMTPAEWAQDVRELGQRFAAIEAECAGFMQDIDEQKWPHRRRNWLARWWVKRWARRERRNARRMLRKLATAAYFMEPAMVRRIFVNGGYQVWERDGELWIGMPWRDGEFHCVYPRPLNELVEAIDILEATR